MPPSSNKFHDPMIKTTHAYSLAHAAQCKLHMSASDPDRNLRFMLGHSFMLDKALYRVAQIEEDDNEPMDGEQETFKASEVLREDEGGIDNEDAVEGQSGTLAGGKVKFDSGDETPAKHQERKGQGPLPDTKTKGGTEPDGDRTPPDEGPDDYDLDNDDSLGLTRFASASGAPPRMIPDDGEEEDNDLEEAISPPALPGEFDLSTIISGPESEDVSDLYERVRGCPCHGLGDKAEKGKRFWEVGNSAAGETGRPGKRMAIMQVEA